VKKPLTGEVRVFLYYFLFLGKRVIQGVGRDTISSLIFLEGFQALGRKDFSQECLVRLG